MAEVPKLDPLTVTDDPEDTEDVDMESAEAVRASSKVNVRFPEEDEGENWS